jgi:serine-type D-Ala-D-Ala carboxypeptidase/endopeptidase
MEIALGWHMFVRGDDMVIWHDGGTGGHRSFVGFDPEARVGVVVLANTATNQGVADIGLHLLNEKSPLLPAAAFAPPKERKEISVDPKILDKYVGKYQLAPGFILTITREGDHLYAQATGQSKNELFAERRKRSLHPS